MGDDFPECTDCYQEFGSLDCLRPAHARKDREMPRDEEDQTKLTQGLVDRLLNKFPNASPGALERLAEEARSNPLSIAAVPSDWAQLAIDPAEPKSNGGFSGVTASNGGAYGSLTYAVIQQRMNDAMNAMAENINAQALTYGQTQAVTGSFGNNNYPTYGTLRWGQSGGGFQEQDFSPPAPVAKKPEKPKPLEIAAPTGKRTFLTDDEI